MKFNKDIPVVYDSIHSNVLFNFQIWLADWLLENNPNKPKVRQHVEEA
jgi:hypothetical protein